MVRFSLRTIKKVNIYSKHYIYALIDPNDLQLKYVGLSNNPHHRFKAHISSSFHEKSKKGVWINKLFFNKQEPILHIIHECENRFVGESLEKRMIKILNPPLNTKI